MTKTELYVLHATSVLLAVVFKTISVLKEYPENGLNLEACSDKFNLKVARKEIEIKTSQYQTPSENLLRQSVGRTI